MLKLDPRKFGFNKILRVRFYVRLNCLGLHVRTPPIAESQIFCEGFVTITKSYLNPICSTPERNQANLAGA